jgi:hypothetical protein
MVAVLLCHKGGVAVQRLKLRLGAGCAFWVAVYWNLFEMGKYKIQVFLEVSKYQG